MRYCLLVILNLIIAMSYANSNDIPKVGIAPLIFGNVDASIGLTQQIDKSNKNFPNIELRPQILKSINNHIAMYSVNQIASFNLESHLAFSVFNASADLHNIQTLTPDLFNKIKISSQEPLNLTESNESQVNNQNNNNTSFKRFILIGFIESIKENEQHTLIDSHTVIIYNLEIRVNYKLVDLDTNKIVSSFVGLGHGGTARIITDNHEIKFNKSIDNVVVDMFNGLEEDVKHALQVHQNDFVRSMRLLPPHKTSNISHAKESST